MATQGFHFNTIGQCSKPNHTKRRQTLTGCSRKSKVTARRGDSSVSLIFTLQSQRRARSYIYVLGPTQSDDGVTRKPDTKRQDQSETPYEGKPCLVSQNVLYTVHRHCTAGHTRDFGCNETRFMLDPLSHYNLGKMLARVTQSKMGSDSTLRKKKWWSVCIRVSMVKNRGRETRFVVGLSKTAKLSNTMLGVCGAVQGPVVRVKSLLAPSNYQWTESARP